MDAVIYLREQDREIIRKHSSEIKLENILRWMIRDDEGFSANENTINIALHQKDIRNDIVDTREPMSYSPQ